MLRRSSPARTGDLSRFILARESRTHVSRIEYRVAHQVERITTSTAGRKRSPGVLMSYVAATSYFHSFKYRIFCAYVKRTKGRERGRMFSSLRIKFHELLVSSLKKITIQLFILLHSLIKISSSIISASCDFQIILVINLRFSHFSR